MENKVAVLFARKDSRYKAIPGCDVYDQARDARTYQGWLPVIAHPPCRAWGNLRKLAKPAAGEKRLAIFSVRQVRRCGGVLEHPAYSTLWSKAGLPLPHEGKDKHGGWTLAISQHWWGHRAEKKTWLYIVGVEPHDLPPIPMVLGHSTHVITQSSGKYRRKKGDWDWRPECGKAEREHTPVKLCHWLVELAERCKKGK